MQIFQFSWFIVLEEFIEMAWKVTFVFQSPLCPAESYKDLYFVIVFGLVICMDYN